MKSESTQCSFFMSCSSEDRKTTRVYFEATLSQFLTIRAFLNQNKQGIEIMFAHIGAIYGNHDTLSFDLVEFELDFELNFKLNLQLIVSPSHVDITFCSKLLFVFVYVSSAISFPFSKCLS